MCTHMHTYIYNSLYPCSRRPLVVCAPPFSISSGRFAVRRKRRARGRFAGRGRTLKNNNRNKHKQQQLTIKHTAELAGRGPMY